MENENDGFAVAQISFGKAEKYMAVVRVDSYPVYGYGPTRQASKEQLESRLRRMLALAEEGCVE